MWIEWPAPAIIAANCLGLPAVQLGCAWLFHRLPPQWFEGGVHAPAGRSCFSERYLAIRRWKDRFPDGATWFGGVAKAQLPARDRPALLVYARETRRGEACHWLALTLCSGFLFWNPPWACAVIAGYALLANLPCILILRYNRRRIAFALSRSKAGAARANRS